jgi:uncharacterized membrane protein YfcA
VPTQTIIQYNIVSVMIPLVLVGSLVGSFVSLLLPDVVLTILLVLLLIYTCFDSFKKAFKLFKKETVAINLSA